MSKEREKVYVAFSMNNVTFTAKHPRMGFDKIGMPYTIKFNGVDRFNYYTDVNKCKLYATLGTDRE